jgi:hypothetical protein
MCLCMYARMHVFGTHTYMPSMYIIWHNSRSRWWYYSNQRASDSMITRRPHQLPVTHVHVHVHVIIKFILSKTNHPVLIEELPGPTVDIDCSTRWRPHQLPVTRSRSRYLYSNSRRTTHTDCRTILVTEEKPKLRHWYSHVHEWNPAMTKLWPWHMCRTRRIWKGLCVRHVVGSDTCMCIACGQ